MIDFEKLKTLIEATKPLKSSRLEVSFYADDTADIALYTLHDNENLCIHGTQDDFDLMRERIKEIKQ